MKASIIAAVFVAGFAGGLIAAHQQDTSGLPAERVTGIGGVFIKAKDPKALGTWYREKLGIAMPGGAPFGKFDWREAGEPGRPASTAWALFKSDSTYFAPSPSSFMIDYRVRNLDRMLAQLKALGVSVEGKVQEDANGKFAWIMDPEGNKVELWEPK